MLNEKGWGGGMEGEREGRTRQAGESEMGTDSDKKMDTEGNETRRMHSKVSIPLSLYTPKTTQALRRLKVVVRHTSPQTGDRGKVVRLLP